VPAAACASGSAWVRCVPARRRLGLGDLRVQFLEQDVQLGFVEERQLILGDPIRLGPEALVPQQFQALQQELDLAVELLDGLVPRPQFRFACLQLGLEVLFPLDLLGRHLGDDRAQLLGVAGELLSGFGMPKSIIETAD
jgi:hypothetical protein